MSVALIDIQSGNLHSVANALRAAGCEELTVTSDPDTVLAAERIVLPGVGAFGACAANLRAVAGLEQALGEAALRRGTPFLGICVGMQLMADAGDEGCTGEAGSGSDAAIAHAGLGWIGGTVRRIEPRDPAAKVPHMGWNDVVPHGRPALVPAGEAYFLHSYAFTGTDVIATTDHGGSVTAAIGRDNLVGVQFHPEKSQRYGIELLKRFLAWRP